MQAEELLPELFKAQSWDFAEYVRVVSSGQFDRITVLNGKIIQDPRQLRGIHVRKWMRFGNSVVQLSNLAQLCSKFPLDAVFFQDDHPFFDLSILARATGVPFLKRDAEEFNEKDGLVLSGQFFFDSPYRLFDGNQRQEILDCYIAPMLPNEFINGCELVDDTTLTVHIRAGDAFSDPIHPGYGQPPLAYYRLALETSRPSRVLIVVEDLKNPVTTPFAEFARSLGMEVVMCTSDLRTTLRILFNSFDLVGGIGTFLWAVQTLSQRIRKYWYFQRLFDKCVLARRHIRVTRVIDAAGHYAKEITQSNWGNTPAQRQMMIDYPVSALKVEKL